MAWEAYTLSNAPTALALLGIAMTVPLIALLLFGGVVSDRHGRRQVMLIADLARAVLLALLGALAASGALRLWQMMVIVAIYGGAQAFFDPASDAILPAARAGVAARRSQRARAGGSPAGAAPVGPGLGGVLVGVLGPGAAFLADAATFLVSARGPVVDVARARPRRRCARRRARLGTRDRPELREGFSYVRRHVWLWGTFASAGVAYLLFMGPAEVLLPFMVKHTLHGSGVQLGLVLGAGGLGSVACRLVMMRSGLPARSMTFIYVGLDARHARGRRLRARERRSGS